MWLFSKIGFFSAVQHWDNDAFLVVRARDAKHLVALVKELRKNKHVQVEIIESPDADYPVRIIVAKTVFATWLADHAEEEIDYPNFKNVLDVAAREATNDQGSARRYATALHAIWRIAKDCLDTPRARAYARRRQLLDDTSRVAPYFEHTAKRRRRG